MYLRCPVSSAQLTKSQLPEMRDYMANKAGSKCCTKSGDEHEYKGQPRYSADEYLFYRAAYKSLRLERSKEK